MASKSSKQPLKKRLTPSEENLSDGLSLIHAHPLFSQMKGIFIECQKSSMGKECAALVSSCGQIYLNKSIYLSPKQWIYVIAHCLLHLAFGHFDEDKMPEHGFNRMLWNIACDIYIAKFLADIKFGESLCSDPVSSFPGSLSDEKKIYQYLLEQHAPETDHRYGTASPSQPDMLGLEHPIIYDKTKHEYNRYASAFAYALAYSVDDAVKKAGGVSTGYIPDTRAGKAAKWFINHYPLLGGLAASFRVIEDKEYCIRQDIHIAAVNADLGEIYINPAAHLSTEEWKFVLSHEYLHAGLEHQKRSQGRDPYLWNVACDFVINGWLQEMGIGQMPLDGGLYDEQLKGMSAESIYDQIQQDLRKYAKLDTFRGYHQGDILSGSSFDFPPSPSSSMTLDDFCRNALMQGLECHTNQNRGFLPAGLVEEIRALAMPPIPWDVELGNWFSLYFPPLEKQHTYARPSRRQSMFPDIPRPRYVFPDIPAKSRTFGVIVDTSGSMSSRQLGMALGSIASYASARDVSLARVVFCDARAYDAGYLTPEEIAGRVEIKGRGGTVLQPGVDLLENAEDFPKNGPILLITDGWIEKQLCLHHEHAFLLPRGNRLPFRPKGPVFYFAEPH